MSYRSSILEFSRSLHEFFLALLVVGMVTAVMLPFRAQLGVIEVLLVYLASVTVTSLLFELRPSVLASTVAFLAFNFFFTVPYYTFSVEERGDILALIAFLGLAILVTQLVGRIKIRTMEAIRRGRQTETLYQLSVALIRESEVQGVQQAIVERVREVLNLTSCAVLVRTANDRFQVAASAGEQMDFVDRGIASVARWSLDQNQQAGLDTSRAKIVPVGARSDRHARSRHEMLFIPVRTRGAPDRVLVVVRERGQRRFDDEESQMLATFANQAAIAVERTLLVEEHTRAEVLARSDELKSALLSAVSHDLRTPLASIKAAATALLQPDFAWDDHEGKALLEAIDEEADRLNRLVTNLLDLSRIEGGQLNLALDWYDASALIAESLERCRPLLAEHDVSVELPEQDVLLEVDFVMITEVLSNLIENAAKYSPVGGAISISARLQGPMMEFSVRDEGVGVAPDEQARIFDKFYRVESKYRPTGSGMGLAISRGFVEAHGGRIWVRSNPERGSTFSFTVPIAVQEYLPDGERSEPSPAMTRQ
jgi:two-component system sensor histidine kinase KdpD